MVVLSVREDAWKLTSEESRQQLESKFDIRIMAPRKKKAWKKGGK
jgi:hypothetical protein